MYEDFENALRDRLQTDYPVQFDRNILNPLSLIALWIARDESFLKLFDERSGLWNLCQTVEKRG